MPVHGQNLAFVVDRQALVHQLARAEYQELVNPRKRSFIQIIRYNKEQEDNFVADRKRELEERIGRQKGVRWIIEALHCSNIPTCAREHHRSHPPLPYRAVKFLILRVRRSGLRYRPIFPLIVSFELFVSMSWDSICFGCHIRHPVDHTLNSDSGCLVSVRPA